MQISIVPIRCVNRIDWNNDTNEELSVVVDKTRSQGATRRRRRLGSGDRLVSRDRRLIAVIVIEDALVRANGCRVAIDSNAIPHGRHGLAASTPDYEDDHDDRHSRRHRAHDRHRARGAARRSLRDRVRRRVYLRSRHPKQRPFGALRDRRPTRLDGHSGLLTLTILLAFVVTIFLFRLF